MLNKQKIILPQKKDSKREKYRSRKSIMKASVCWRQTFAFLPGLEFKKLENVNLKRRILLFLRLVVEVAC
jgi:hypothetical protein